MKTNAKSSQSKKKDTSPNTVATEQTIPLLNLSKVPQDVEQAQSSQEKIYIPSIVEGNTGALTVKSSSPSWKKKIAIVTAGTVALIGAITGATALVHYITSQNGNKSNGISSPNNTLATTTDFTRNTINPYLKNATNSYSRAAANSSTPSFDEKLKEASRNGDVFSETEFAKYNRSFTELTRLDASEELKTTGLMELGKEAGELEVTESSFEDSVNSYNSTSGKSLSAQEQSNSSLTSTNITNSYFENGIDLSNSTYDESSEREPQAQEDNGKEKNRNRREKVITPVAKSTIDSSMSSLSVPTSTPMSSPTSVTMSEPASTLKRYTLVLDPDSPTPSKTGATMEQMQADVVFKEVTSPLTPGLCSFIENRFKFLNTMPKNRVFGTQYVGGVPQRRIFVDGSGSKNEPHIKNPSGNEIHDIITKVKNAPQLYCDTPPCLRGVKVLGDNRFSLFFEGSFEDQDKFLEFLDEKSQRHGMGFRLGEPKRGIYFPIDDGYSSESVVHGYDMLIKFVPPRKTEDVNKCMSLNNYEFNELNINSKNHYIVTIDFQVLDAQGKAITNYTELCNLIEERLHHIRLVTQAQYIKQWQEQRAATMPSIKNYQIYQDALINGNKTGEAAGEIITFKEGRGGVFVETSRVTQKGRKDRVVHKTIYRDKSERLERKQDQRKSGDTAPIWVNEAALTMNVTQHSVEFWHNKSLTGWTESRAMVVESTTASKYPLPERDDFLGTNLRLFSPESMELDVVAIVGKQLQKMTVPHIKSLEAKPDGFQATIDSASIERVKDKYQNRPDAFLDAVTYCWNQGKCGSKTL